MNNHQDTKTPKLNEKIFCNNKMKKIEKKILNYIQNNFPIVHRPFKTIADEIGITEDEIIGYVKKFYNERLIRRFGAVFNSSKLDCKSTLVAIKVADKNADKVAAKINKYDEVTHNYHRQHEYNIWLTITAPTQKALGKILDDIKNYPEVEKYLVLDSAKQFKIGVVFNF